MMLTTKQSVHYGYRTVHDLPTPPRTSPTIVNQDQSQNPAAPSVDCSPQNRSMSAPHRGLPPPAGMALPQPPVSASAHQPPPPGPSLHQQALATPSHSHPLVSASHLPHAEESSTAWIQTKVEEEKRRQEEERRRQEEERTRQENLRLEQRKIEFDMLRTSLDRGIPPQLIPIVFAAMGGGQLPQAILEYAQSFIQGQSTHTVQSLPAPSTASPEHHRDPQYAAYTSGSTASGAATGLQQGFIPYQGAGSPPRPRAHTLTMGAPVGRPTAGSSLPRLHTEETNAPGTTPGMPSYFRATNPAQQPGTTQPEQSPSIYFHHWQPPASQAHASQPDAPAADSPRKRKATGAQPAAPPPSSQIRTRSPPFGHKASAGRHRGHSRQRSDISSYRPAARARGDSYSSFRGFSPGLSTPRDGSTFESSQQQQLRSSAHSVTSLLSDQPSPGFSIAEPRQQQQQRPHQTQQHPERQFQSQQQVKGDPKDSPMQANVDVKLH